MAADKVTVTNRTGSVVPLARGVILPKGGQHAYNQRDLTLHPYIADHLSRAVAAGLVTAVTAEGETLTPERVLALGRGIHAHTHDELLGTDPLDLPDQDVVARDDVAIYADPAGDDANDGLTPATAVLTLGRVVELLPRFWAKKCRVFFAAGTYNEPEQVFIHCGRPAGADAEALSFIGGFTTVASGTVGAYNAGTRTLTDLALALAPDELRGARIRFLDGDAVDYSFMVAGNGATTIQMTATVDFGFPPSVGSSFVVERPNVTINYYDLAWTGGGGGAKPTQSIGIVGVKFQAAFGFGLWQIRDATDLILDSCEFDLDGGFGSIAIYASCILSSFALQIDEIGSPATSLGGVYIHNGWAAFPELAAIVSYRGFMDGWYVCDDAGWSVYDAELNLGPADMRRGRVLAGRRARVGVVYGCQLVDSPAYGIRAEGGAIVEFDPFGFSDISDTVGDAVVADSGSIVSMYAVSGTGNTGYGVRCQEGGRVYLHEGGNTVTGALGDTRLQDAVASYASLLSSGSRAHLGSLASITDVAAAKAGLAVLPELTSVQKEAVVAPKKALAVFDSTENRPAYHDGAGWRFVGHELSAFIAGPPRGAYAETLPAGDPFPTEIIWYTDAGKTARVADLLITRDAELKPTQERWRSYRADGATVAQTVTDTIAYGGGAFEVSRTRVIT